MEKSILVKSIFRETEKYVSKEVRISGWVRTLRASNAFGFIEVNDGSFFKNIQVVFGNELSNFKEISKNAFTESDIVSVICYKFIYNCNRYFS